MYHPEPSDLLMGASVPHDFKVLKSQTSKTDEIMDKDKALTESLATSINSFHDICHKHQKESPDECSVKCLMSGYLLGAMTGKGGCINIQESLFPNMSDFGFHAIHPRNIKEECEIILTAVGTRIQAAETSGIKDTEIAGLEGAEGNAEIQDAEKAETQALRGQVDVSSLTAYLSGLEIELIGVKADLGKYRNFTVWLSRLQKTLDEIKNAANVNDMQSYHSELKRLMEAEMPELYRRLKKDRLYFDFVKCIFLLYPSLVDEITQKIEQNRNQDHYHLVIVAHGKISPFPDPYLRSLHGCYIKDIIFYSPWNCAVDATVVHRIATGTIKPSQRDFCYMNCSGSKMPTLVPDEWNKLDDHPGEIPSVDIGTLDLENGVDEQILKNWKTFVKATTGRLVIPFVPRYGETIRTIPLWVMVDVCRLGAVALNKRFTYHHAACLTKYPQHSFPKESVRKFHNQYWLFAKPSEDMMMIALGKYKDFKMSSSEFSQYSQFQDILNPLL